LNRLGIVALLFAVAFFLKYAFDNDWIGPAGRVACGLVAGAALMVASQRLLARDYRYFSEGLAGLGAGVLYLSFYAAWEFYALVPSAVAFAGMVAVTGALIGLAVGRDSERLAFLALAGGFMTPGLLGTDRDAQVVLFTYLAVLDAGLLALAWLRSWRSLEPFALLGTIVYFGAWYDRYYAVEKLARTLCFAALFFVEFAALALVRARRGLRPKPEQLGLVLVNFGAFLGVLHLMLHEHHRWGLTVAVLLLGAVHLAALRLVPERPADGPPIARLLFGGLALTCATLAIPIRLEGRWIVMAWAVEGAVLVWSGLRARMLALRGAGLVLWAVVAVMLVDIAFEYTAQPLLWNPRCGMLAVAVACFAVGHVLSRRRAELLTDGERRPFQAAGVAVTGYALLALSLEAWDFFGQVRFGIDRALARQLGLSLLWALSATAMIVAGVRLALAGLRWQGLILLGVVVTKVFLFDLSFLERGFRILSFLGVGIALLVVSFLYQRRLFHSGEQT